MVFQKLKMVKNSFGGSRTKSFARKSFTTDDNTFDVPLPKNKYEKIAFVSKIYGNGMCLANIIEPDTLSAVSQQVKCHFRGKFKGKYKKNNIVSVGSFILIGLREWETTVLNADLLFVFGNPNVLPNSFTSHPSVASLLKTDNDKGFDSLTFTYEDEHHLVEERKEPSPSIITDVSKKVPDMETIQECEKEDFDIDEI